MYFKMLYLLYHFSSIWKLLTIIIFELILSPLRSSPKRSWIFWTRVKLTFISSPPFFRGYLIWNWKLKVIYSISEFSHYIFKTYYSIVIYATPTLARKGFKLTKEIIIVNLTKLKKKDIFHWNPCQINSIAVRI